MARWRRWRRRRVTKARTRPRIREKEREITCGMSNSERNSTRSIFRELNISILKYFLLIAKNYARFFTIFLNRFHKNENLIALISFPQLPGSMAVVPSPQIDVDTSPTLVLKRRNILRQKCFQDITSIGVYTFHLIK